MKTEDRIREQKLLIEEIGAQFDREGMSPVTGRVLALLMVMDKEQYTFDEIVEELEISKSSASVALKTLEIKGNVEYITLPGDRRRHFRLKARNPFVLIDDFVEKMRQFQKVQERILELKADHNSRISQFLIELNQIIDFVLSNTEEIKEQYAKHKK